MQRGDLLGGRYRLIERIAHGGMATVWRAFDERLSRTVAIKLLDRGRPGSRRARARIRIEAQVLAQLTHPYVPDVYDYVATDSTVPYLVMELVDGQSLESVLAGQGVPPWRVAVRACAQVASALAAAHARGLVHRDVTAANVMLTRDGGRLIDFGISSAEGERETDADGRLHGTLAYIAPERLTGRTVTSSADVYSLGVLLYQALAGRLPWPGATAQQVLLAQQLREPDPLPVIAGLPVSVAALCLRCLAPDPHQRPTAAEVTNLLRAALGQATDTVPPVTAVADRSPRAVVTQIVPSTTIAAGRPHRPRFARIAAVVAALTAAGVFGWLGLDCAPAGEPVTSQALGAAPVHPSNRLEPPLSGFEPDSGAGTSTGTASGRSATPAQPHAADGVGDTDGGDHKPKLHKAKGHSQPARHQPPVKSK